jgi:hypothetical protein
MVNLIIQGYEIAFMNSIIMKLLNIVELDYEITSGGKSSNSNPPFT